MNRKLDINKDLSVLTWNVLADSLAESGGFSTPSEFLKWKHRSQRILKIIREYDPDIICLQEVDHYYDYFEPGLPDYNGLFKKKEDDHIDGVALFWKKDKFRLENYKASNFYKSTQVYIAALLKSKDSCYLDSVCIGTTHLKAKPGFEEVRNKQMQALMRIMTHVNGAEDMIICGDLNDVPDSPVIKTIEKKYINAYKECTWTTWKKRKTEVKRTIDYIFHNDHLLPTSQLNIPTECEILPNKDLPSDHIPLFVTFVVV